MSVADPPPPTPLPGLPGGQRGQRVLAAVLTGLIVLDHLWLHGAIFDHRLWGIVRWAIAVAGLLVGALAYSGVIR